MGTRQKNRESSNGADVIGLGDLKPLTPNARKRTERSAGMIVDSLQRFGAARSIVLDEDNTVLAGNGTVEAAGVAGIERVRVVEADGNELIAVRRRGLSHEQKTALALADNRTAELAEWSIPDLSAITAELPDVTQGLFSATELDIILDRFRQDGENDPAEEWKDMPECESQDLRAWKSIRVNFASAENMKAFAELIRQPLTENTRSIWYPEAEIGRYADKRYTANGDES